MLALEKEEAIGEVFNICGPAPFAYEEEVTYVKQALNKPVVKVTCPRLYSYELSIARARSLLGYDPQYDASRMIREALQMQ